MIPQEAVEAAKASVYGEIGDWYPLEGIPNLDIHAEQIAKLALEAAAPFLRAQALEDAAKYIEDWIKAGADDPISPDATRTWLRARAATERGQG